MALYFLLHDADRFHHLVIPAFSASWRQRNFAPCQPLAEELAPAIRHFTETYHTKTDEPLITHLAAGLPFDRGAWRLLVGEVLLYGAAEIPELQTAPDALCLLLAPARYREGPAPRDRFAPIEQAHFGSRDLVFGAGWYRPEHAGWNDANDVARLGAYLGEIETEAWTPSDLAGLRNMDEADLPEELEFVREWFPVLRGIYQRARERGQVVICETL